MGLSFVFYANRKTSKHTQKPYPGPRPPAGPCVVCCRRRSLSLPVMKFKLPISTHTYIIATQTLGAGLNFSNIIPHIKCAFTMVFPLNRSLSATSWSRWWWRWRYRVVAKCLLLFACYCYVPSFHAKQGPRRRTCILTDRDFITP